MTNREKINDMSVQELANFLDYHVGCMNCPVDDSGMCYSGENCSVSWKRWLESEAADE